MILSLSVILQSPDFLYLTEIGIPESEVAGARSLTDWEIASRLSYLIWDSMPDDELFAAANNGDLQNAEQLRDQAVRMLRDEKSRMAVIEFFRQWLGASYAAEVDPDYTAMNHIVLSEAEAEYFDYVNAEGSIQELIELDEYWGAIKRDIKLAYEGEFELFVDETVFGSGTLKDLLTSRNGFVSQRTARFYGVSTEGMPSYTYVSTEKELNVFDDYPEIEMFAVPLPANQRAGIFTQGAFLAGHSHPNQPSPVLRGVFLRERLLCLAALAPPGDIPALSTSSDGSWTTNRERFAQHTEDPACASCHVFIDGAGFPFENYDAVGAWRDTDNGETVDASGELLQTDVDGPVANAIEMLEALAESRQVHDCAVLQLYRYATHRPEEDSDAAILTALQQDFWDDGGLLPNLYLRIVLSSAFRSIPSNDGGAQ